MFLSMADSFETLLVALIPMALGSTVLSRLRVFCIVDFLFVFLFIVFPSLWLAMW